MTDLDWESCTDPIPVLSFLLNGGKLSQRKARLFGVAACRRIWHLLSEELGRRAVEVAERFADGDAGLAWTTALRDCREAISLRTGIPWGNAAFAAYHALSEKAGEVAGRTAYWAAPEPKQSRPSLHPRKVPFLEVSAWPWLPNGFSKSEFSTISSVLTRSTCLLSIPPAWPGTIARSRGSPRTSTTIDCFPPGISRWIASRSYLMLLRKLAAATRPS
jgi:hypothetical protein